MSKIFDVIVRPRLRTEKGSELAAENKYVFEVKRWATKTQIKEAVEQLLQIEVARVNTMIVAGKTKRRGGRTSPYKKAIVTLKEGYTFNEYALEQFDDGMFDSAEES